MFTRLLLALVTASFYSLPVVAEQKSFDSNGVKISYIDQGKGEGVVLLHGFSGSASEMWGNSPFATQLLSVLAAEYRVIAPDLRGHGKSDKPHDLGKYGFEMAEDVTRLLDHLRITRAHIVGYSMGSAVAGKILIDHPNRLLSVTFGGGGPLFVIPDAFSEATDATAASLDKGEGIGPLLIALTPEGQPKVSPEQAAAISQRLLQNKDQKALSAVLRGQKELQVTEEQLKASKVPVQFVYGSRDTLFKTLALGSYNVLPLAEVEVVENGDHMSTAADSKFRTAVLRFLHKHAE